jgi:Zn-dependent peptidase ImmA (M78 family)/DNA-binding XRE family transcriptional regulator
MPLTRVETWEDIGARVAAARAAAGLTQAEIADRLGIHRSAVARIERGKRELDALELARLAETLGRSVAWFVTPPPRLVASHRSLPMDDRAATQLEDELEAAARDIKLLVEIGELASVEHPVLQAEDSAQAEEAARLARQALGSDDPIHDLSGALEQFGLLVFSLDLGPDVIDGAYVRVGGLGVAVVNGRADPGRRRFNAAHELGHHLLGDEYTADIGLGQSGSDHERVLNAFAVHFLAPRESVTRRWRALTAERDDRAALICIAADFRLSWTAACSHACTLGLVDADRRAVLELRRPTRADYVELGVRFTEELVSPAAPQAFARACLRAYRHHKIGASRTVELLRGTLDADELPLPQELPLDALRSDFE